MRFRKFLKPYRTRGSSFREHTEYNKEGDEVAYYIYDEDGTIIYESHTECIYYE